jgi:hypothetical protein
VLSFIVLPLIDPLGIGRKKKRWIRLLSILTRAIAAAFA